MFGFKRIEGGGAIIGAVKKTDGQDREYMVSLRKVDFDIVDSEVVNMKKNVFAVTAFMTMIALVFTICENTEAKVRMSRKTLTIEVSKTYTLKLKGVKRKITWKSSKPSIAKVNKKGKVTALRKGKAIVTAKAGKKIFKCVVIVQDKKNTEVLNKATPKPDEPTVMPKNPAATAGQPTLPPDLSTPPVRTPDNSGSDEEYCGPGVIEYAAYMDCRISDIGEGGFRISDADGEVIYDFSWPEDLEDIVYDGILTEGGTEETPFNSYNKFRSYAAKGETINYSDIRIGDIVDVVYGYGLDVPVKERNYRCAAINVHKREE